MKPNDMRSLPPAARQARRMQVVALRAAGSSYRDIAAQTGLSRTGVFDICKRVDAIGAPALDDAPKGRQTGHGGMLDAAQCGVVRALIFGQTPDRLALPYPLWTKAAVIQLIGTRFGIRMSDRTVALYLARWGLRPPKPMAKASLRSGVKSRQWLQATYPGIAARARIEDAEINWVDEGELGLSGSLLSVFSTVNNRGQMHWASYAGALDAHKLIALLRRRIQVSTRKIILILNPLCVHRADRVVAWLVEHEDAIEVVHLPAMVQV
ncbi:winged helix-turn-helix domain-containing protein [Roseateles albus]|nr:winged helix-turn-helix domain-containing protein [Roseateles albus]